MTKSPHNLIEKHFYSKKRHVNSKEIESGRKAFVGRGSIDAFFRSKNGIMFTGIMDYRDPDFYEEHIYADGV